MWCCWPGAPHFQPTSHCEHLHTLDTAVAVVGRTNPAIRPRFRVARIVFALMGALVIHDDVVVAAVVAVVPLVVVRLVVVVVGSLAAHQVAAAVAGLFASRPTAVAVFAAPPTAVAAVGIRVAPPAVVGLLVRWRRLQIAPVLRG